MSPQASVTMRLSRGAVRQPFSCPQAKTHVLLSVLAPAGKQSAVAQLLAVLKWPDSACLSCCVCVVIAALLAYRWHMQRHTPEGAMKLPDMGNDGKAASDTSEAPDMMQQFRQKV